MKKIFWSTIFLSLNLAMASGCSSGGSSGGTVTVTATSGAYEQTVLSDTPTYYWLLNETSGVSFADQIGGNTANVSTQDNTAVQLGIGSPIINDSNTVLDLLTGLLYTSNEITSPASFSIEFWVQVTPQNAGGRIFGFGNSEQNLSSTRDRHVYMDVNGVLWFGINDGARVTINSGGSYADGGWHYVVATYDDPSGNLNLYVDSVNVSNGFAPNYISLYNGWWRMGFDSTSGWPNNPGNLSFDGGLGQVAIYNYALAPSQVLNHYVQAGY